MSGISHIAFCGYIIYAHSPLFLATVQTGIATGNAQRTRPLIQRFHVVVFQQSVLSGSQVDHQGIALFHHVFVCRLDFIGRHDTLRIILFRPKPTVVHTDRGFERQIIVLSLTTVDFRVGIRTAPSKHRVVQTKVGREIIDFFSALVLVRGTSATNTSVDCHLAGRLQTLHRVIHPCKLPCTVALHPCTVYPELRNLAVTPVPQLGDLRQSEIIVFLRQLHAVQSHGCLCMVGIPVSVPCRIIQS